MIRALIYGSAGFAAGYSLMRAIECRAQGVPLSVAFQLNPGVLLTPVSRLVGLQAAPTARRIPAWAPQLGPGEGSGPVEPDAVIPPSFAR